MQATSGRTLPSLIWFAALVTTSWTWAREPSPGSNTRVAVAASRETKPVRRASEPAHDGTGATQYVLVIFIDPETGYITVPLVLGEPEIGMKGMTKPLPILLPDGSVMMPVERTGEERISMQFGTSGRR
jgi:hypothetical protein